MDRPSRRLAWEPAVVVAASLVGGAALFALAKAGWPGEPTACLDRFVCYCELPRPGLARQPVNTWTNLACFPVAVAIARDAHRLRAIEGRRVLARLGLLFALTVVAQGLGSMAFHASLTLGGAIADAFAMFLVLGLLLALALVRAGRVSVPRALAGWAALVLLALAYRLFVAPVMAPLFVPVAAALLIQERRLARAAGRAPALSVGLAAFAAGAVAWALSLRPGWPLCSPGHPLQGHGVWHVCAAVAAGALWVHARNGLRQLRG